MDLIECPDCGSDEFHVTRDFEIRCVDCGWSRKAPRPSRDPGGSQPDHRPIDVDDDDIFKF